MVGLASCSFQGNGFVWNEKRQAFVSENSKGITHLEFETDTIDFAFSIYWKGSGKAPVALKPAALDAGYALSGLKADGGRILLRPNTTYKVMRYEGGDRGPYSILIKTDSNGAISAVED